MSNEFKRVPTCGENDVDLRVATEPRRAADRLTASVQFHELAQGYRAATPDGAQAAYEKLCAFLEGRAAPAALGELNGGMHASIFVKVWGDAGGGDAGRIALANYAFELGKKSASAPSVDRNNLLDEVADQVAQFDKRATPKGIAVAIRCMKKATPQPVDAAQAVTEGRKLVPIDSTTAMDEAGCRVLPRGCDVTDAERCYNAMLAAAPVAQPTDTTKGA